jgi:hypothetical protein
MNRLAKLGHLRDVSVDASHSHFIHLSRSDKWHVCFDHVPVVLVIQTRLRLGVMEVVFYDT